MVNMKYTIGEFSKITSLSKKTLRYYHNYGLLSPSNIDDYTDIDFIMNRHMKDRK